MVKIGLRSVSCQCSASMCATKSLLAGDAEKISEIFSKRVVACGAKDAGWPALMI